MDRIQTLRALVNERLNAAAEEIFGLFEKTVITYEEEIHRQRKLLDMVSATGADSLHLLVCEEGVPCKQQEGDPNVGQEDPKSPQLKVEQEQLWTGQGGAQLQGLSETNASFSSTPSPLKRENNVDEKPCSLFIQTQTEDNGKEDPIPTTSTAQIKTEPVGEECAVSQQGRNVELVSNAWLLSSPCPETEAGYSGQWVDYIGTQSDLSTPKSKTLEKGQLLSITTKFKTSLKHLEPTENLKHHHTGEDAMSYRDWGKQFAEQRNLNVYLRKCTGERTFNCTVCGKAFSKKGNLNVHMRNHTGEKPFRCTYCGESFRTKTTLKVHTRRHTGEKPFGCIICGQRFRQSSTVRIHMRIHTGEKPFSCTSCDKTFSEKGGLQRHMTVHLNETLQSQCH